MSSLEMSDNKANKMKCQGSCGSLYPVIKKEDTFKLSSSANSGRIARLQNMIRQSEKYHVGGANSNNVCKNG
jgi:hypothetical protein